MGRACLDSCSRHWYFTKKELRISSFLFPVGFKSVKNMGKNLLMGSKASEISVQLLTLLVN